MRKPKALRVLIIAAALSVVAAACGGSSATEDAVPAAETTAPATSAEPAPETTPAPPETSPPETSPPETTAPETTAVPTTVAASSDSADVAVVASAGCGASNATAGPSSETLGDRAFLQFVPAAHDGETPVPLVLNFHGLGSNGGEQILLTDFTSKAEAEGFVVIHPEGSLAAGTETTFFNTDISGTSEQVDDVAFSAAMLDELEATLCVDTNRIFATGMSNGGFMASVLGCALSERFAAVVSVAGITYPEGDCAPTRSAPLLHVHGTADIVVPFEGGESSLLGDGGTLDGADIEFVPIPGEVDQWAEEFGCDAEPEVVAFSDEVSVEDFVGCEADLEFWIVDGGGHTWPGTPTALALQSLLGFSTDDFNTTDLAWDWFLAHPKR